MVEGVEGWVERKVFYHNSEVCWPLGAAVFPFFNLTRTPAAACTAQVVGNVALKPGDEVAFVPHTHTKTGELNAQRVRRTKEGPPDWTPPKTGKLCYAWNQGMGVLHAPHTPLRSMGASMQEG